MSRAGLGGGARCRSAGVGAGLLFLEVGSGLDESDIFEICDPNLCRHEFFKSLFKACCDGSQLYLIYK